MTKEEKQLLIIDLCTRLPYGVFVEYDYGDGVKRVTKFHGNYLYLMMLGKLQWKDFKPYLRPMSSMTEDEREEYRKLGGVMSHDSEHDTWAICAFTPEAYDWLNKKQFDYRGLIPKGLALEAPKDI